MMKIQKTEPVWRTVAAVASLATPKCSHHSVSQRRILIDSTMIATHTHTVCSKKISLFYRTSYIIYVQNVLSIPKMCDIQLREAEQPAIRLYSVQFFFHISMWRYLHRFSIKSFLFAGFSISYHIF